MNLLNPSLPYEELAARYRTAQRIQIGDLFTREAASDLHGILANHTKWSLVHNNADGRVSVLSGADLAKMPIEEKNRRLHDVLARARNGFSFLYRANLMADRYIRQEEPDHPLHRVFEFINGPNFVAAIKKITGITSIVKADAQATLYGPGDFLTRHDDKIPQTKRRVAYVISLSRDWKADWGGQLQFFDNDGGVEAAFVPRFNSLCLFTVPQMHAVTSVSPYAPMARYSITGWFIEP